MKKINNSNQLKNIYINLEKIDSLTMYIAYFTLGITGSLMMFLLLVNDIF